MLRAQIFLQLNLSGSGWTVGARMGSGRGDRVHEVLRGAGISDESLRGLDVDMDAIGDDSFDGVSE